MKLNNLPPHPSCKFSFECDFIPREAFTSPRMLAGSPKLLKDKKVLQFIYMTAANFQFKYCIYIKDVYICLFIFVYQTVCVLLGLVMFFKGMNLDTKMDCGHFGSRFQHV